VTDGGANKGARRAERPVKVRGRLLSVDRKHIVGFSGQVCRAGF
jgi:hypothetical protein